MDQATAQYRAEAARLLKAARWLLGSYREKATRSGRPSWEPTPLSAEELADREPLPANRITANYLGRIERMEAQVVPMQLRAIARALDPLPEDWFEPAISRLSQGHADAAAEHIRSLRPPAPATESDPRS